MSKQQSKQARRAVPAFATEAAEAEWWHKNCDIHGKQLLTAVNTGKAQVTNDKLRELAGADRGPIRSH